MAKFVLKSDEHLYKEGYAAYLKSAINVHQGDAAITSKRFVFCNKSRGVLMALGPIVSLMTKATEIEFEIPLSEIISIHRERHGLSSKYVLTRRNGSSVAVQFRNQDEWLQTLVDAVEKAVPGIKVERIGDRIAFA